MRDSPPEVFNSAAEAVSDIDTVGLPAKPAEGAVVATQVRTECETASFSLGVVGVVNAYVCCSLTTRCIIYNL